MAEALQLAHSAGIIHGDIKPANILVDSSGQFHLTDFGLGRVTTERGLGRSVGVRHDLHALGQVLVLCTSRASASPAGSLARGQLPPDFLAIVGKLQAQGERAAYDSAGELVRDLQNFIGGFPVSARPAGLIRRATMWSLREPWIALTILIFFCSFVWLTYANAQLRNANSVIEQRERSIQDLVQGLAEEVFLDERLAKEHFNFYERFEQRMTDELRTIAAQGPVDTSGMFHIHRLLASLELVEGHRAAAIDRLLALREVADGGYRYSATPLTAQSDGIILAGAISNAYLAGENPDVAAATRWLEVALAEAEGTDWAKQNCQDPRVFIASNLTSFMLRAPNGASQTLLADEERVQRLIALLESGDGIHPGVAARVSLAHLIYAYVLVLIAKHEEVEARALCDRGLAVLSAIPDADFTQAPRLWRQRERDIGCILTLVRDVSRFIESSQNVEDRIRTFQVNFESWRQWDWDELSPGTLFSTSALYAKCASVVLDTPEMTDVLSDEARELKREAARQVLTAVDKGGLPLIPLQDMAIYNVISSEPDYVQALMDLESGR